MSSEKKLQKCFALRLDGDGDEEKRRIGNAGLGCHFGQFVDANFTGRGPKKNESGFKRRFFGQELSKRLRPCWRLNEKLGQAHRKRSPIGGGRRGGSQEKRRRIGLRHGIIERRDESIADKAKKGRNSHCAMGLRCLKVACHAALRISAAPDRKFFKTDHVFVPLLQKIRPPMLRFTFVQKSRFLKRDQAQKRTRALALMFLLVLSMTVSACGKRPGSIDPPPSDSAERAPFPRVYPDPSTDPAP